MTGGSRTAPSKPRGQLLQETIISDFVEAKRAAGACVDWKFVGPPSRFARCSLLALNLSKMRWRHSKTYLRKVFTRLICVMLCFYNYV